MKLSLFFFATLLSASPAFAREPRTFTCTEDSPSAAGGLLITVVDEGLGEGTLTYSYSPPSSLGALRESFTVKRHTYHMGQSYAAEGVVLFVNDFAISEGEDGQFTRTFDKNSRLDIFVRCRAARSATPGFQSLAQHLKMKIEMG